MVWWDDSQKQLWLLELTVCFETSFEEARERKEVKYGELVSATEKAGYNTTLQSPVSITSVARQPSPVHTKFGVQGTG